MRSGISLDFTAEDRARLEAIVAHRNQPQKHVWRTRIILLSDDGLGTAEIMRRTAKAKTCVWRWQERFMQEGVGGILQDKTRPSRKPALPQDTIARVVELPHRSPPGEITHWTSAAMAKTSGISQSSVLRIWRGHGLQPHPVRQFKLCKDPHFIEKLRDVTKLQNLSFGPRSQIASSPLSNAGYQALDTVQAMYPPGKPMGASPRQDASEQIPADAQQALEELGSLLPHGK